MSRAEERHWAMTLGAGARRPWRPNELAGMGALVACVLAASAIGLAGVLLLVRAFQELALAGDWAAAVSFRARVLSPLVFEPGWILVPVAVLFVALGAVGVLLSLSGLAALRDRAEGH